MGYSKKREKEGMPKKHDPKKREKNGHINVHEKYIYNNNNKRNIYIAMSSCYPNKGERDS